MILKKISIFIGIIMFGLMLAQKDKQQLQKQNAELKKKIAAINADLAKTKNEARLSLAYLNNVNNKIALREKVYNNTQKEKRFIEDDIYKRQLEINKYNRELATLRKNYAAILVKAYKNKGVQNKVTFILSSKNMGEALRRIQYLKQYGEYQEKKAAEINDKANQIRVTLGLKQKSVKEKENLLTRQKYDLAVIEGERKEKQLLLEDFKKNEAKLTAELRQKQAESKKLEAQIRAIINEEIKIAKAKEAEIKKAEAEKARQAKIALEKEKARIDEENRAKAFALAEAKRKADIEAKKAADLVAKKEEEQRKAIEANRTAERIAAAEKERKEAEEKSRIATEKAAAAKAASDELARKTAKEKESAATKINTSFGVSTINAGASFSANRGKMSFPVDRGTITHRFGRQQHPVFPNIVEENNGIRIGVSPGTKARAVFPGVVSNIIPSGDSKTVIIKHGDYFTVYINLSVVNVAKNQNIAAGTTIGTVGQDIQGSYSLDFQIYNKETPVDPLGWVSQ